MDNDLGEGELTVGTQDPAQDLSDDTSGQLGQIRDLIVRGLSRVDARFDRLEGDVAGLKTDVAGLKTDVAGLKTNVAGLKTDVAGLKTNMAETNARLGRFELATERRFNRVDAVLERLFGLIRRDEFKAP